MLLTVCIVDAGHSITQFVPRGSWPGDNYICAYHIICDVSKNLKAFSIELMTISETLCRFQRTPLKAGSHDWTPSSCSNSEAIPRYQQHGSIWEPRSLEISSSQLQLRIFFQIPEDCFFLSPWLCRLAPPPHGKWFIQHVWIETTTYYESRSIWFENKYPPWGPGLALTQQWDHGRGTACLWTLSGSTKGMGLSQRLDHGSEVESCWDWRQIWK